MASTYSDSLKLELMETGANANTWGNNTNTNLETIDAFNAGYLSKSVAGSANVTLTTNNADPTAEASNKVIEFTGALTGDITVFIPAVENNYIFFNNTSGSHTLTVAPTGHGSNGVAITQGAHTIQYCTGNKVIDLFANSFGNLSTKTEIKVGDNITLSANGTVAATNLVGNGAGLTGVGEFASGTKAMFVQTAAPTGFTTDTSATLSECCLQVVSGTGGGTGGSDSFTTTFTSSKSATGTDVPISTGGLSISSTLSAGSTTITTPTLPSHSHGYNGHLFDFRARAGGGGLQYPNNTDFNAPTNTGNAGGGGGHSHNISGFSLSGTLTSPVSASVPSMDLKYVDTIVATKD
mgnify:FL=1